MALQLENLHLSMFDLVVTREASYVALQKEQSRISGRN
jgi:hypothetical protein